MILFTFFNTRSHSADNLPSFSIIVLPDTQYYSSQYPKTFEKQTEWIASNKERLNIVYVAQLGDVVNNAASGKEWQEADKALRTLDTVVPYGIAPGNHDLLKNGSSPMYEEYFNAERLTNTQGWQLDVNGHSTTRNNYHILYIRHERYIAVSLEFCPPDDVLKATGDLLEKYRDYKAIVSTHSFLNEEGVRDTNYECKKYYSVGKNSGEEIWNYLIEERKIGSVVLFLSGHNAKTPTGATRRSDFVNGHTVHQLLSNYQHLGKGGDGYLRIMTFYPGDKKIKVSTYSPYINSYRTDSVNDFTLPLD